MRVGQVEERGWRGIGHLILEMETWHPDVGIAWGEEYSRTAKDCDTQQVTCYVNGWCCASGLLLVEIFVRGSRLRFPVRVDVGLEIQMY